MVLRLLVVTFLSTPAFTLAQSESAGVRGDSSATRKRLAEAESLVTGKNFTQATILLQAILRESGRELIQVNSQYYVSAKSYAEKLVARLRAEQRAAIQADFDESVRKLISEGLRTREPLPLLQVVSQHAFSEKTAEAFHLLGELAFERGDFASAEYYWSRQISLTSDDATIQARRILALHYLGDADRARAELIDFEKKYQQTTGWLAGREGVMAGLLRESLARIPDLKAGAIDQTWPTLGGNVHRTGCASGSLRNLTATPLWSTLIPNRPAASTTVIPSARTLAFHPVMDAHRVYLSNGEQLDSFDVKTGKWSTPIDVVHPQPVANRTLWRDADFTLSLDHGRLLARLGNDGGTSVDTAPGRRVNEIVSITPGHRSRDWSRRPPVAHGVATSWDGVPLAIDGLTISVFSRIEGGRRIQALAAYDERSDKPVWVTEVCEVGSLADGTQVRDVVLTLAGPNVVLVSQTGVIAAVNARNGQPAWSYRYPHIVRPSLDGRHRDLSPAVAAGGRVFVAPNDCDSLFAFDAESGSLLWKDGPIQIDYIIGVAGTKVIAAIAGPHRGLRAYHYATGSCDAPQGWKQHDDPDLATHGRGLIVNDLIAWPTAAGLYFIRVQDGLPARPLLREVNGNLAFADGKLAVANATTISLFGTRPETTEPPAKPLVKTSQRAIIHEVQHTLPTMPPVMSALPNVDRICDAPPQQTFLPPDRGDWGRHDGEPTLAVSHELPDLVVYQKDRVYITTGKLLECKAVFHDSPRWQIDLLQPVRAILPTTSAILCIGKHFLAAIHPDTGRILWVRDGLNRRALSEAAISSSPQFNANLLEHEGVIVVQMSNARVRIYQKTTGEVIAERPSLSGDWLTPPVSTGQGILIPDYPESVLNLGIRFPNRSETVFKAKHSASLRGESIRLVRQGDSILLGIARNHGFELEQRSVQSLEKTWSVAPWFNVCNIDLTGTVSTRSVLCLPVNDQVVALSTESGRELWRTPIDGSVVLHAAGNVLIAVPKPALTVDASRALISLMPRPTPGAMGRLAAAALIPESAPILFLDWETGVVKHRLEMTREPILTSTLDASGLWFATARTIYRVK